jgi:serine/threonine protein kinase
MTTVNAFTMAYAALEVLDDEPPTVKSDAYSLGMVALFIVTGRLPC